MIIFHYKNKLLDKLFIILTLIIISGCNNKDTIEDKPSFKFTNINLDQVDTEGNKQFKLVTDRAYIIESSKQMKAIDPLVIFYYKNEPYYNLNSKSASIVDNGNKIILDKKVYMQSIRDNNFILETKKVEWNKNGSIIIMSGGINSVINGSSFKSNSATYDYKENTIKFFGINNYKFKDKSLKQFVSVNARRAIWNGDKKRLLFFTPNGKVITNLKVYKKN